LNRREHQVRTSLTRLGVHATLLGLFAIIGGALRGFNLLLVIAALLVGALLVQWRFNRRAISGLTATRKLPSRLFAGQSRTIEVKLHNRRRWLPAWMVRVTDSIQHAATEDTTDGDCGVALIPPGGTAVTRYDCRFTSRGRYRFGQIELASIFPLALCRSRKAVASTTELFVFPRLLELTDRWQQNLIGRPGGSERLATRSGWSDGEFFGLRSWQPGDSLKWIHWRTTARIGEPAVRQFEQQRRFDLCLIVDACSAPNQPGDNAETAIRLAATIISEAQQRAAARIVLGIAAAEPQILVAERSSDAYLRLLMALSTATLSSEPPLFDTIERALCVTGSGADLIVLSPRRAEQANRGQQENLAHVRRPMPLRWVDVTGSELRNWVKETAQ